MTQRRPEGTTTSEREALWRLVRRTCDPSVPTTESRARRKKLERNTAAWLKHYFPGVFRLPWGTVHRDIFRAADYTVKAGGRFCVAAPRGTGKSFCLAGVCLKAVLCGAKRFPVLMPWDSKSLKKTFSFWHKALCFNHQIAEDYPEFVYPFVHSRGISQNCLTLTRSDGSLIGARILMSEGMLVLPDSLGVVAASTINGNPLGMQWTTQSGEGLRPDLIFIDDPQSRESSSSRAQIRGTIDLIDKDISGLGGPDTDMPMLVAATVKQSRDVAEHYLTVGGDWSAQRTPQILSWPEDMKLWEDFNKARLKGHDEKDLGAAGIAFYKKHKAALRKGCVTSWKHRYSEGQPDDVYSAMLDFFTMGEEAFAAERQNDPVVASTSIFDLSPESVTGSMVNVPRRTVPQGHRLVVGHIDINRSGLHYVIASFDQTMTCHVVDYGKEPRGSASLWKKNAPELERKQNIFHGLSTVCKSIQANPFVDDDGKPRPLSMLLIDRGYEADVVNKFCQFSRLGPSPTGFNCTPARGFAHHKYSPRKATLVGAPREACHMSTSNYGHFLAFSSCVWRETAQRAFLADAGAPGGISVFAAKAKSFHLRFAEHITAERLAQKYTTDLGMRYEWRIQPGDNNDYLDSLTGCYVAASWFGLSPSGLPTVPKPRPRRETRKSKTPIS